MNLIVLRICIVFISIATFILSTIYVTPLLLPFILGWFVAASIDPIVQWLERWFKLSRSISILLALLLFLTIIVWASALLFLFVSKELVQFSQILPTYITQFGHFLNQILPIETIQHYYIQFQIWYGSLNESTQSELYGQMSDWMKVISDRGIHLLQQIFTSLLRFIAVLPSAITLLLISVLSAFFISKDFVRINDWVLNKIPKKLDLVLRKVLNDLKSALFGFMKAQFTLICITSAITIIGLLILNVENAIAIGVIAGLVDLIPYLGTGTVFIPWLLYLYFTKNFSLVIGLAILYGVIILTRQILEPRILAKSIGLHPLVALIALFVGLQLFGVWGMLASPFVVILLQALHRAHVFTDVWDYIVLKNK